MECTTGKRSVISLSCATHHGCDRSAFYVCPWRSIVAATLGALSARVDAAIDELRKVDISTLAEFRGVGRAQLPSSVIGCLVHGAEHSMRHVGQLSVTSRIVRSVQ